MLDWLKQKGKQTAKGLGNIAYDVTGADNYMESYRKFRKGDVGGAFLNLATGLGESALLALPAAGAASRVGRLASKSGAGGWALRNLGGAGGSTRQRLTAAGLNIGGRGLGVTSGAGAQARPDYDPRSFNEAIQAATANRGAGSAGTTTQATGQGGGSRTGGGSVGSTPSELFGLDPVEQAMIDAQRRGGQREFQNLINNLARERTGGSIQSQASQRGIGRRARGGMLDLMSGLSESAYGGAASPAQGGVAQQFIRDTEASQRAAEAGSQAARVAELGARETAGRQSLRDLLAQLEATELAGRARQSFRGLQSYGGR